MSNIHLWQYIVIAGPAAVLGGLVVWALNREYVRGREDALLSETDRTPEQVIRSHPSRFGKSFAAFLQFQAACQCGARMLYRGPGYVAMPDSMYAELVNKRDGGVVMGPVIMDDCPGSIVPNDVAYRVEHKDRPIEVKFDTDVLFDSPHYAEALASYLMKPRSKPGRYI